MKLFATVAILLFAQASLAGDGGFRNFSCMSASGRTMLNIVEEHGSMAHPQEIVRFIIDGKMLEIKIGNDYENPAEANMMDSKSEDSASKITTYKNAEERTMIRIKKEKIVAGKTSMTIKAGFFDPRAIGYEEYADNKSDITVACRVHEEGP